MAKAGKPQSKSQLAAPSKKEKKGKGGAAAAGGEGRQFSSAQAGVRFRARMKDLVEPTMMKEFGWGNPHQVPRLVKVVINMGIGDGAKDIKQIENAMDELALITGQRPVITRARRSQAQFKIREGMPIGTMLTLRGGAMLDFLDKLFNVALPRVRDFQGLPPNAFDSRGNYTLGIREQIVFPEIDYDKISRVRGMDITIVTTASDDATAKRFLELLGLPLRKPRKPKTQTAEVEAVA